MDEIGRIARMDRKKLRGWAGGLTAIGALAAVALMAMAPIASAAPGVTLKAATPLIYYSAGMQGCSKGSVSKPTLSMLTGVGHAKMAASGLTCPLAKGGSSVASYGSGYSELGASETLHLAHAYSSFNTTFNVSAAINANATGKIAKCPYNYQTFSTYYWNGTTFVPATFAEYYQNCYSEAYTDVFLDGYVQDLTTGTYTFIFGGGTFGIAGVYADNYTEWINFTSSGSKNLTYNCTICWGSLGVGGTTLINQNYYMNTTGSWASGDRVTLTAYVYLSAGVSIYNAKSAHAVASINAALANHVDITNYSFT